MATSTLPHSPDGFVIPFEIRSDEERKEANARLLNALWALGENLFSRCQYETERYTCHRFATVHHLESGNEYCEGHFEEVGRG